MKNQKNNPSKLYPIRFQPILKERIWGGDRLAGILNKESAFPEQNGTGTAASIENHKIPETGPVGESWEICGLPGENTIVQNGFLAENSLEDLMEVYLGDLVGEFNFNYYLGEFPLLVKLLDIRGKLSVQVHPDDRTAMERHDCMGKAEFWYVLEADPGAKIHMGFNRDTTPREFYDRCKNGTVEELLNAYTPKAGDCFYIRPGCVHSASGGILLAEIQQSSDITYRLYDWGRENHPETARRMDLEEAIDIIDYKKYDEDKYYLEQVSGSRTIVTSDQFIVKGIDLTEEIRTVPGLVNSFIIYMCIRGEAAIRTNDDRLYPLRRGETLLIPASMEDFRLQPVTGNPYLLEIYTPQLAEEKDDYLDEEDAEGPPRSGSCDCCGHDHPHGKGHGCSGEAALNTGNGSGRHIPGPKEPDGETAFGKTDPYSFFRRKN